MGVKATGTTDLIGSRFCALIDFETPLVTNLARPRRLRASDTQQPDRAGGGFPQQAEAVKFKSGLASSFAMRSAPVNKSWAPPMKRSERRRLITGAASLVGWALGGGIGVALGGIWGGIIGGITGVVLPWVFEALPNQVNRTPHPRPRVTEKGARYRNQTQTGTRVWSVSAERFPRRA